MQHDNHPPGQIRLSHPQLGRCPLMHAKKQYAPTAAKRMKRRFPCVSNTCARRAKGITRCVLVCDYYKRSSARTRTHMHSRLLVPPSARERRLGCSQPANWVQGWLRASNTRRGSSAQASVSPSSTLYINNNTTNNNVFNSIHAHTKKLMCKLKRHARVHTCTHQTTPSAQHLRLFA